MTILQSSIVPSSGYLISRSLRFRASATAYLSRTPAVASNRKTFTLSLWNKGGNVSSNDYYLLSTGGVSTERFTFTINSTGVIQIVQVVGGTVKLNKATSAVYRDPSAWYHIVLSVDTTQVTPAINLYVNGVQITSFSTNTNTLAQNDNTQVNNTNEHDIGNYFNTKSATNNLDGYLTEVNFIDGQALTPSSFGQTNPSTGVWQPIKYTGTYGTNGFYLNFSDNSNTTATTLGKDSSGNGNNWTPNNFSVTAGTDNDSLVDTPTPYGSDTGAGGEVRGNYCTANAIDLGSVAAPTNGNLAQTLSGTNGTGASGTFTVTTGKWYWEVTSNATTNAAQYVGVIRGALPSTAGPTTNPSGFYYGASGNNREDGTTVTYGNTWLNLGVDYIIGVALDCDANTVVFYVNNASQGTRNLPSTTSGWKPQLGFNSSSGSAAMNYNFGQRPFAYTAPSGYKALCTQNLPTPTIGATASTQAGNYFAATTWVSAGGTETITNTVNGVSCAPDFVWLKNRSISQNNYLVDANRGISKILVSNTTSAEVTDATFVTALNSNGFSLGAGGFAATQSIVGWQWNAGGSNATNTSGSITSTVRANTTAGFSIVTYTGTGANATVGHGLGVAPSMVIVKSRSGAYAWAVYHASLGGTKVIYLNETTASATGTAWNSTAPTSSVFSIGVNTETNTNTATQVAYCFAPVAGYSAFGSYTGNGSTDGPFVFTNFQPKYLLLKRTDNVSDWVIQDEARNTYNPSNSNLWANLSNAEVTSTYDIDFLSNGFKFRTATQNANGGTYIYAAFSTYPFKYSTAR